jgi:hypothetical protein
MSHCHPRSSRLSQIELDRLTVRIDPQRCGSDATYLSKNRDRCQLFGNDRGLLVVYLYMINAKP